MSFKIDTNIPSCLYCGYVESLCFLSLALPQMHSSLSFNEIVVAVSQSKVVSLTFVIDMSGNLMIWCILKIIGGILCFRKLNQTCI